MNKPVKNLIIKAQHIGPIMKLDGSLSDEKQNLIFARNGTGKSFLARALRMLVQNAQHEAASERIPANLISEESRDGKGWFKLYEGEKCVGGVELNTNDEQVSLLSSPYIFHVFSEDYVTEELRLKRFELNGAISHEIIVGRENAELDQKQTDRETNAATLKKLREDLSQTFNKQKEKLKTDFGINARLAAYTNLSIDTYLREQPFSPEAPEKTSSELLADYNKFKSLPNDPVLPDGVSPDTLGLDLESITETLKKTTSPSSVADEVKQKIAKNPDFFRHGLELKQSSDPDCPFCTQTLTEAAISAISVYQEYFAAAEAKEKNNLKKLVQYVKSTSQKIDQWKSECSTAKSRFDNIRGFFPSMKDVQVTDYTSELDQIKAALSEISAQLDVKRTDLTKPLSMPNTNLAQLFQGFEETCRKNRGKFEELSNLVSNSSKERKAIQAEACTTFRYEFFNSQKDKISKIRALEVALKELEKEIEELRKTHGSKVDARERVADTLEILLKRFFGEKYTLQRNGFKVLRRNTEMLRGVDRTLSDGEKSVMAFCYFLAQSHYRVDSNEDYAKLYYVFDDPVTSMSFDYVYEIVQTLKYLRIGTDGEIEFSLSSTKARPKMLILTHNNYFYNVASSNKVVKPNGLFQLAAGTGQHQISAQTSFSTPHKLQLKHVLDVSKGTTKPDHTTANCIRSVVESMWKFCRPDLDDFGKFTGFLIEGFGIEIKSVLINDLSHGGKFDDGLPLEQDLKDAAKEAVDIVRKFAEGQLKNL